MLQKIPVGVADFRTIITEDYRYIDKTEYLYKMISRGKFYFLSRPRRFGKSMTIATLQELYSGSKDLFDGLWIADKWDWTKKHPIIRISFTTIGFQELGLSFALNQYLDEIAKSYQIELTVQGLAAKLAQIIKILSTQAKVVILIDEYDAPITHYLGAEIETAKKNRELLKGFYTILKEYDTYIEFVFIAGVSKFSKVGIFSGLNNLVDISMSEQFATFLGYTQEELEENYADYIEVIALKMQLSKSDLLEKIRFWYNGYRFHHKAPTVYNPVSTNLFFYEKEFENYWFQTGTPTFLINYLKTQGLYDFVLTPQTKESFDIFDLENINPHGLMYQTGYLTISRKEDIYYYLDYPNNEVRKSMVSHLLEAFGGFQYGNEHSLLIKLEKAFKENEIATVISVLQTMFKKLPYQLYEKQAESFYLAMIHLLFTYLGFRIHSEVCTNDGRVDSLVETTHYFYIFEFKLDKSGEIAFQQIIDKKYYEAYYHQGKRVMGIGVNFSSETKNIQDWIMKQIV